jgi:hypothetical protein
MVAKKWIDNFAHRLTAARQQPLSSTLFFKALVCFALVRLILVWNLGTVMLQYHSISLPQSILGKIALAPAFLANSHPLSFQCIAGALLLAILIAGPNYFVNLLFCWLVLNLVVVYLPFGNGADLILLMLSVWCIPLHHNRVASPAANPIQVTLFNLGRLLCQWQVIFIYLSSGIDKIFSETWRTGEAFELIRHFDSLYNPTFPAIFQNPSWDIIFAWLTIIFELLFGVLVWNKRARRTVLMLGVLFHLIIWWMLSLPDFAVIMMLSLLVFLEDDDVKSKLVMSHDS